jgi:ElaB/YqjD/DUF883 family membrane-anchored ribosome-binding protein
MEGIIMKAEVLEKNLDFSAVAAQAEARVDRMKAALTDAVDDGISNAKRAVKQSRRAAEDIVDDAEYRVKQHPLSAIGVTFGVGLGFGALIGFLVTRAGACNK